MSKGLLFKGITIMMTKICAYLNDSSLRTPRLLALSLGGYI